MLKRMLLPLDGSRASDDALAVSLTISGLHEASVTGLGVVDVPTITAGLAVPVGGTSFKLERDASMIADARERVQAFLKAFDEACGQAGVEHQTRVEETLPYDAINEHGRHHDLIVIGRDTCFHFETTDQPGDTLAQLVRDSSAPLLVVPPGRAAGGATLAAVDAATPSAHTIQCFMHLRMFPDRPVHFVAVAETESKAERRCAPMAEYARHHGYEAFAEPVAHSGKVSDVLLARADALGAGLVVMGAHGGGAVHTLFFGITAKRLIRDARVPMFIHH